MGFSTQRKEDAEKRFLFRPVREAEMEMVYRWRNEPRVREVMPFSGEIELAAHRQWWPQALADESRRMMVLEDGGTPSALVVFLEVRAGVSATWGLYTAPQNEISRGKALAAWIACDYAGLVYAFETLRVRTLRCDAIEGHRAALRIRERMGFVRTGVKYIAKGRPRFVQMEFSRTQYDAAWAHPFGARGELRIEEDSRDMPLRKCDRSFC
jgi:UDP-4-amino-4,6-dideoxy-N-acetyl-beta-L-altrosamine N-acetyltransferase